MVSEGDRVSADVRLLAGAVEMDLSTLTGESMPVLRTSYPVDPGAAAASHRHPLQRHDLHRGRGDRGRVRHRHDTELGRIASLSQRVGREESPLEAQVKRVARLIAVVAIGMGVAFIPLGTVFAGLSLTDTVNFAIGLLVANVPEGLLPTITLALAVGVRLLARQGALVKRISAVETLGSTSVICTDKTGTLTLNRMRAAGCGRCRGDRTGREPGRSGGGRLAVARLAGAAVACNNAGSTPNPGSDRATRPSSPSCTSPPTWVSPFAVRSTAGRTVPLRPHVAPDVDRRRHPGGGPGDTKGAPEEVLPRCSRVAVRPGRDERMTAEMTTQLQRVQDWAGEGLRLLAVASRWLRRTRTVRPVARGSRARPHPARGRRPGRPAST